MKSVFSTERSKEGMSGKVKKFNVKLKVNREYRGINYSVEADLDSLKERDIREILGEAENFIDHIFLDDVEISKLDEIAVNELRHGRHGSFLEHFFLTWQLADPSNKRVLKRAFEYLVEKYGLGMGRGI